MGVPWPLPVKKLSQGRLAGGVRKIELHDRREHGVTVADPIHTESVKPSPVQRPSQPGRSGTNLTAFGRGAPC